MFDVAERRRLLISLPKPRTEPIRHLKIASVIVREFGSFVARQSCPALPSIHNEANPGDVSLAQGGSYKVLGKNKEEATHYLLDVPGANPSRRWVSVDCGELSAAKGAVQPGAPAAVSYLLVASWEPAFCETKPTKNECKTESVDRFDATHFSLHGLWPQPEGLAFCDVPANIVAIAKDKSEPFDQLPPVNLSVPVRANLDQVMPGTMSALERHEWIRHGTCMPGPPTPDAYFSAAIALLAQLNGSKLHDLFAAHIGAQVTIAQIKQAMSDSFGASAGDGVVVHCNGHGADRTVTEIWISLAGAIDDHASLSQLISGADPGANSCPSGLVKAVR